MSFLVSKDGQQLGPWTADEVNAQLAGGMLESTDLGWTEGFEEWMPLNQIDGLVRLGTQMAPATATVSMAASQDAVPGLVDCRRGGPGADLRCGVSVLPLKTPHEEPEIMKNFFQGDIFEKPPP